LESKLARLRELRNEPPSPQLLQELRVALRDRSNFVVADAAEISGDNAFSELAPDLVAAFERFLVDPAKTDKLCRAKIAIARVLDKLEYLRPDVFLRGISHFQPEPVWGGEQDTAAPLRGACAFTLVRIGHHGVLNLLVDLLADPEKDARVSAAQALAYNATQAAGLLLRLKARVGDKAPEVISECLGGLLKLDPEEGLPFVAEFLQSADEAIQESAAIALGESRRPEAFPVLKDFWEHQILSTLQETILVAMALLRLPAANDFLLSLISEGSSAVAAGALSALAVHRHDARLRDRVAAAVAETGSAALRAQFEDRFRVSDSSGMVQ
jgi:HEAT repeat protein